MSILFFLVTPPMCMPSHLPRPCMMRAPSNPVAPMCSQSERTCATRPRRDCSPLHPTSRYVLALSETRSSTSTWTHEFLGKAPIYGLLPHFLCNSWSRNANFADPGSQRLQNGIGSTSVAANMPSALRSQSWFQESANSNMMRRKL